MTVDMSTSKPTTESKSSPAEGQYKCPYCENLRDFDVGDVDAYGNPDNGWDSERITVRIFNKRYLTVSAFHKLIGYTEINYCPMCGKRLSLCH